MAKSKYETHVLPNLAKIIEWAEKGVTIKDIAKKVGVSYTAFRKYIDLGEKGDERYVALAEPFTRACIVSDGEVENALYKSCMGYNAPVTKHYKLKTVEYDPETGKRIREVERLVSAEDTVHVPANTTAQMFWLANRQPERWKYKPMENDDAKDKEQGVIMMPEVAPDG